MILEEGITAKHQTYVAFIYVATFHAITVDCNDIAPT